MHYGANVQGRGSQVSIAVRVTGSNGAPAQAAGADVRPFRRGWHSPADASGHHQRKASEAGGKFQPQDWPAVSGPADPAMIAMLAERRLVEPLAKRYGFTAASLREAGTAAGLFYDSTQRRMSVTRPVTAAPPPQITPIAGGAGWKSRAACGSADPELFYAEDPDSIARAKSVCGRCPVRSDCLESALANGEQLGVWGGLDENERRQLRRKAAA